MTSISSGIPQTDSNLSCLVVWGMIWNKGLLGKMPLLVLSDKLIREEFKHSR